MMKKLFAFLFLLAMPVQAADTINFQPENFPHFRKCLANARAGVSRCRVLVIGDSTSWGEAGVSDAKTYAWPSILSRILPSKLGLPSDYDSFMGIGGAAHGWTYNPHITQYSGAWNDNAGIPSLGGDTFQGAQNNNGTFSFRPSNPVDTFIVWYLQVTSGNGGSIGAQVNNGAVTTINTVGPSFAVGHATITAPLGINTLNLTNNTSVNLPVNIIGIESSNSQLPGISLINASWSGSDTVNWLNIPLGIAAWQPATVVTALAPDVVLIDLNINDAYYGVGAGTYQANLQSIVSLAQATSDVVLVTSLHGQNGFSDAVVSPYVSAVYTIAGTTIPVIDNWTRNVSFSYEAANSWKYDDIHDNKSGYADFAAGVAAALGNF